VAGDKARSTRGRAEGRPCAAPALRRRWPPHSHLRRRPLAGGHVRTQRCSGAPACGPQSRPHPKQRASPRAGPMSGRRLLAQEMGRIVRQVGRRASGVYSSTEHSLGCVVSAITQAARRGLALRRWARGALWEQGPRPALGQGQVRAGCEPEESGQYSLQPKALERKGSWSCAKRCQANDAARPNRRRRARARPGGQAGSHRRRRATAAGAPPPARRGK
jgi:hypothetical protein